VQNHFQTELFLNKPVQIHTVNRTKDLFSFHDAFSPKQTIQTYPKQLKKPLSVSLSRHSALQEAFSIYEE